MQGFWGAQPPKMSRNFNKGGSAPLSPPRNHPCLGLVNTLQVFWRQTNQKSLLVLLRIPKYPGKVFPLIRCTLRIRISPEQEKYALDSVFQNLRISAYQRKYKAKFDKFFSVFANIWVNGNRASVLPAV